MKTLIASVIFAAFPNLSCSALPLGMDAREKLIQVCIDEVLRVESYASLADTEQFWTQVEIPNDSEMLYSAALETRASFGAIIIDALALSTIRDEAEMRSDHLEPAMENAENSRKLVECALTEMSDSNITTTSLFLGWLDCHKPLHEKLSEQYRTTGLDGPEFARIVDETWEVHTSCRELQI